MHEVAAMRGMVRTVLECMQQAGASRVTNVQLVLGASGHFTADAAYQHFEALTKGTPIEDASLTISRVANRLLKLPVPFVEKWRWRSSIKMSVTSAPSMLPSTMQGIQVIHGRLRQRRRCRKCTYSPVNVMYPPHERRCHVETA